MSGESRRDKAFSLGDRQIVFYRSTGLEPCPTSSGWEILCCRLPYCKQLKSCTDEKILERRNRKNQETDVSRLAGSRRAGDVRPLNVFATKMPRTATNLTAEREKYIQPAPRLQCCLCVFLLSMRFVFLIVLSLIVLSQRNSQSIPATTCDH